MRIISGIAKGTKLYTLTGLSTRPTLDRVKESLFSILQNKLIDAIVLDLFSGSGALGLESLSRGAKKAILCDNNPEAIRIIKRNVQKCHFEDLVEIKKQDYKKSLEEIKEKVDIIFIDPPYDKNIAIDSINIIVNKKIIKEDSIIILETDDEVRELEQLKDIKNINIQDLRNYGRVKLIFLDRKG